MIEIGNKLIIDMFKKGKKVDKKRQIKFVLSKMT